MRTYIKVVCLFLGVLVLTAAAVPRPAQAQLADYLLGPGDRLAIVVFGHKDLSSEATVSANGTVAMPLVGQVEARALTLSELEAKLTERLGKDFVVDPKVSIQMLAYRPFFILGEVNRPGKYDYIVGINVRKAIAMSEGYTRRAKYDPVLLIRDDRNGNPVHYRADLDTPIHPGDTIQVLRRLF
jgi:protein involved in polysaccharide export with SLBB domain